MTVKDLADRPVKMSLHGGKLPPKDLLAAQTLTSGPEGISNSWPITIMVIVIILVIFFELIRFLITSINMDYGRLITQSSSRVTEKLKKLLLGLRADVSGSDESGARNQDDESRTEGGGDKPEKARELIESGGSSLAYLMETAAQHGDKCHATEPPKILEGWGRRNDKSSVRYGSSSIV